MNKDICKKAINKIHPSEKLKNETFEKIKQTRKEQTKKRNFMPLRQLSTVCAVCMVMFFVVTFYLKDNNQNEILNQVEENTTVAEMQENDLPRFENIEQLKKVLKKNNTSLYKEEILEEAIDSIDATITESEVNEEATNKEYSETNTQVQGVDEADTVKTDGTYIYYVANSEVYIINAKNLETISKIKYEKDKEKFYPREIYIKENRLIILGNSTEYEKVEENDTSLKQYYGRINTNNFAKAIVYDIINKEEPIELRQVSLDGNYSNSRMIGDNLYFISTKYAYYYSEIKDEEILPLVRDTASEEQEKRIACTDIVYFEDTNNSSYMLVAGFNINNNEKVNMETFFGANDTVYCSENNLYIAQTVYKNGVFTSSSYKSKLYKFNLDNSNIKLQCMAEVKGNLNDQFSMDEYNGNLRIATTDNNGDESTNQLYILDKDLNQIGKIENLAKGEKIYSVRFVGKVGYVVTFKQVDPLFVIDLSEPTAPKVKGKLKIPGYSSYLHPYDETHIIGIGYNTKSNGYGGITNSNMKMSMFDVSDLENPKEVFHIDIGDDYTYSEITSNHKALFYNKDKDLIGFPVTYREKNAFVIFKINLENGFEKYGEISQKIDYRTNIDRAIYIGDVLYTLSETKIVSYDLNNLKKLSESEY